MVEEVRFGALRTMKRRSADTEIATGTESAKVETTELRPEDMQSAKRGRPAGRRSDPEYQRLTALIRNTTRRKVDLRMVNEPGSAEDLSELVDRLLDAWGDGRTG